MATQRHSSDDRPTTATLANGLRGLTVTEVEERRRQGEVNRAPEPTSRPILAILRTNVLTPFNGILAGAVLLLLIVGQTRDAVLISGLVVFSVLVTIAQELRAKARLDHIAFLVRTRARVRRDDREVAVAPDEIVLGDYVLLGPGDQVVADGTLARAVALEMDESLLTGEALPVPKRPGERVLSGSLCSAGHGAYEVTQVGEQSYVQGLTAAARGYRSVRTPLQRFITQVLWVLLLAVLSLSAIELVLFIQRDISLVEAVRASAVMATLVPQGLVVLSTASYSLGAVRVAQHHALVQQLSAVESLSHVDVLCLDKTGTLTTGTLAVQAVLPLDATAEEVERLVGIYAASAPDANATLRAIHAHLPSSPGPVQAAVPFHSSRQWSALAFDAPAIRGAYVLGAPDVLLPSTAGREQWRQTVAERAGRGQRVLLFARAPAAPSLFPASGPPQLPTRLQALGLIVLQETIRATAPETLRSFRRQGVAVKIISGDHPRTVQALARQAGLPVEGRAVSGAELEELPPVELGAVVEHTPLFGRATPPQKQMIIDILKQHHHHVAMIGDGANDVLPLKAAQLGIAMQSGSPAARAVADMILLDNDFDALPVALQEGRRVINGVFQASKLFVTRDVATIGLILISGLSGQPFPLLPPQVTLIALLTVGLPSLLLVARADARPLPEKAGQELAGFSLGIGLASAVALLATYSLSLSWLAEDVGGARTAVVSAAILAGLLALLFLGCPLGASARCLLADQRLVWLATAMLLAYLVILALPSARRFFELDQAAAFTTALAVVVTVACFAALSWLARWSIGRHGR